MILLKNTSVALTLFISLGGTGIAFAAPQVLFSENFDDPTVHQSVAYNEKWALPSDFFTYYLGAGRQFEHTSSAAHSGTHSLKFNYDGRNGMCNLCGVNSDTHKSGVDGSLDFISNTDKDLTQSPYNAQAGRIVINQNNGYSRWAVVSVGTDDASPNNKLTLKKLADPVDGTPAGFDGGDTVFIARQCGVDGTIGGNIDRRSDCDGAINYFVNSAQQAGQSIFRRVYLKHSISSSAVHQKLRYWEFNPIPSDSPLPIATTDPGYIGLLTVVGEYASGVMAPNIFGLQHFGGTVYIPGFGMPGGLSMDRGFWYYYEEQIKAESAPNAGDGEYRLWFGKAGSAEEASSTPLVEATGLSIPPMSRTSLWGNTQHTSHTIGAWYIDDLKIQTEIRNGPLTQEQADVFPPKVPVASVTQ